MRKQLLRAVNIVILAVAFGTSMSACSTTSWKEEVLLHDGSKIIVTRSVELGGRHELGQKPAIKEQSLSFTLPSTNQYVTWEDHYSEDVGSSNFNPMLLEVVNGTAFVLGLPAGCLSYNKWGRPNPSYVIFKYQNLAWQRITLQDLPPVIKTPNLILSSPDDEAKKNGKTIVSAEAIKALYAGYSRPEHKTILREAVKGVGDSCPVMIRYKCGWGSEGEFNRKYFENSCK